MKKVAIVQSNYIPWKGYFDLIRSVDEFILYDDAQYTARDWRNRNRIKTSRGLEWLSIPVERKGKRFQAVKDVQVSDPSWGKRHWKSIVHAYTQAPFFKIFRNVFEPLYLGKPPHFLSEINFSFIREICRLLSIRTQISFSMDYAVDARAGKNEKLLDLCKKAGASLYLSGPSALDYLDRALFREQGIKVDFFDYTGYPEYPQFFGPFVHEVSALDLIFHTGSAAPDYLKKIKEEA